MKTPMYHSLKDEKTNNAPPPTKDLSTIEDDTDRFMLAVKSLHGAAEQMERILRGKEARQCSQPMTGTDDESSLAQELEQLNESESQLRQEMSDLDTIFMNERDTFSIPSSLFSSSDDESLQSQEDHGAPFISTFDNANVEERKRTSRKEPEIPLVVEVIPNFASRTRTITEKTSNEKDNAIHRKKQIKEAAMKSFQEKLDAAFISVRNSSEATIAPPPTTEMTQKEEEKGSVMEKLAMVMFGSDPLGVHQTGLSYQTTAAVASSLAVFAYQMV